VADAENQNPIPDDAVWSGPDPGFVPAGPGQTDVRLT